MGDRRIGVALSDPEGILATPHAIIERQSDEETIKAILNMVLREGAGRIIIGLPLSLAGSFSEQTEKVQGFANALRDAVEVPVEMRDERLSTVSAGRLMREGKVRKPPGRRQKAQDAIAAAIILQGYLDGLRGESR